MTYVPNRRPRAARLITAANALREGLVPPELMDWTPRDLAREAGRFYRAKGLEPPKVTLASGGQITAYTAATWAEFSLARAYPEITA